MIDEVYKEFFADRQTKRALDSSEVWRNYSNAELDHDVIREKVALEAKLDEENAIFAEIEGFRKKVSNNPKLKSYFKKVSLLLQEHPELKQQVDPAFIKGIELLDFED
ncbi:MAG: hypothetical protein WC942_07375 [Clostridia bacterium]|jgi:hypothetical protein